MGILKPVFPFRERSFNYKAHYLLSKKELPSRQVCAMRITPRVLEERMSTITAQQWIYTDRPVAEVNESHYEMREVALETDLKPGELLVKARYFSVDPYMRIQQSAADTWEAPHPLGTVQGGDTVAEVIAVNDPSGEVVAGDLVNVYNGWQTHAVCKLEDVRKLKTETVSPSTALGVLGMPGRTAWFGLLEAGAPKRGETVLVSGAAGAVGSIVAQLAKLKGCRVIGVAGGVEKSRFLVEELGLDAALDYKQHRSAASVAEALKEMAPEGIDIYFDNVGGMISDAAVTQMKVAGRIVICGQISQYNGGLDNPDLGPRFLHHVLYKRLRIQGILARDYKDRMAEMLDQMTPLVAAGKIQFRETFMQGFENLPKALNALFQGVNTGKMIVEA
jgi:NADPH-dependent curcumin reductase CurA